MKINSAVAGGVRLSLEGGEHRRQTDDIRRDLICRTHGARRLHGHELQRDRHKFYRQDVGTAFQVAGGSGTDTLTAQGFVFSADQRNAIFAAASIEKITDSSGTYNAPSLDSVAPAVTERLNNDTGSLATDNITKDATLTGSGDAGAAVHFTVDGTLIAATATADSNGDWSFTPTGLSEGQHTIVASETDVAGNTGTASLTFMLDSVAPSVEILSDVLNKNGSFTIKGTSDAGLPIKVYDGSSLLGSILADSTGQWSFNTGLSSSSTIHTFFFIATDVAGYVAK